MDRDEPLDLLTFVPLSNDLRLGTLVRCKGCGREAVFSRWRPPFKDAGDDDGQQRLELDVWTCSCGVKTEVPVRFG